MKTNKLTMKLFIVLFSTFVLGAVQISMAEEIPDSEKIYIFPDEYSILDEHPVINNTEDDEIAKALEDSRQKYLSGLIFIKQGDTLRASTLFEEALDELNRLASYPNIEDNEDFAELSDRIIEDYEKYVTDFSKLDENTPLFIIKDKMIRDLESDVAFTGTEIVTLPEEEIIPEDTGLPFEGPDELSIPLPENKYVQKNIKWLTQTKAKKFFSKWLERSGKWFPMMKKIAEEEGVPLEIVYLSMIESALDPNAVSRAKAVGLWQFMKPTGMDFGLNANGSYWIDERRDPLKATRAAMQYLKELYNEFGDWHLALASYNCGQGRVRRAIRRSGKKNPNYWDIRRRLPKETRYYVPLYIATATIAMNPEKYGFDIDKLELEEEFDYETFTLFEPVNIDVLAKCAGVSEEELRSLNPELIKSCTPPDLESYEIRIPKGSKEDFAERFENLDQEQKQPWVVHNVQRYESLNKISRKYGVTKKDIVELNDLRSTRSRLKVGQELKLPISAKEYNQINIAANRSGSYFPMDGSQDIVHVVRRGESLYSISRRYGVSINHIRNMNGMPRWKDNLRIGQRLLIAEKVEDKNEDKFTGSPIIVRHTVKRGESLGRIADDYATSLDDIKEMNRLSDNKIYPGQLLKIKTYDNTAIAKKEKTPTRTNDIKYHKVRRGETISTIAAKYGMRESELRAINRGKIRGNTIYSGSLLKVSPEYFGKGSSQAAPSDIKRAPKYYRIKRGETLAIIARKFGVSLSKLRSLNPRLNPRRIQIGQKIRVQ